MDTESTNSIRKASETNSSEKAADGKQNKSNFRVFVFSLSNFKNRIFGFKNIFTLSKKAELKDAKAVSKGVNKGKRIFSKYATALTFTFIIAGLLLQSDLRPVTEVSLNGKTLAIVPNRRSFDNILAAFENKVKKEHNKDIELNSGLKYSLKILPKSTISKPEQVVEAIEASSDTFVKTYGISVNNNIMVYLQDENTADEVIDKIKNRFAAGNSSNQKIEFIEDVKVITTYAMPENVVNADTAFKSLTDYVDSTKQYTIKSGDTLWDIADNNNIAIEKLFELNPDVSERLQPGQVIKLSTPKYPINVRITQLAEVEEKTPHETKFQNDNSIYKGDRKVITKGEEGKKLLKVKIVQENGIDVQKDIIEEKVLVEAKPEVVAVGTKSSPNRVNLAGGLFGLPAFGSISSRYGYRWGRMHEGVDIATRVGTPVYAAADGKVIFAGWESGYGYLIKIDHGNGYVTYYGHNSKLIAKVGQKVEKGQEIAKSGNTGNSTGPHVHFEVRKSGHPVDPMQFLK